MRDDPIGQSFSRYALSQYGAFPGVEAVDQQCAYMRCSAPGLLEFGAKRDDQQDWKPADPLHGQI